jgi:hypothetical protein
MADPNEIAALQASFQGALGTAERLAGFSDRIRGLAPASELDEETLEELGRVTAAHAIASNALRGLIVTMLRRRGREGAAIPASAADSSPQSGTD